MSSGLFWSRCAKNMKNKKITIFILLSTYSNIALSESWYVKQLDKVQHDNKCFVTKKAQVNPIPFLITPNYYVSWCEKEQKYNLIVLSAKENLDWDSCGALIKLKENSNKSVIYIEATASPYDEPLSMYDFWSLKSLGKNKLNFLQSEDLAIKKAIYFGEGGILYCYDKQWVMSGYH